MTANSFGSRAALQVAGDQYQIYRLDAVDGSQPLPFSLKILLENLLRNEDGVNIRRSRSPRWRNGTRSMSRTPRSSSPRPGSSCRT